MVVHNHYCVKKSQIFHKVVQQHVHSVVGYLTSLIIYYRVSECKNSLSKLVSIWQSCSDAFLTQSGLWHSYLHRSLAFVMKPAHPLADHTKDCTL